MISKSKNISNLFNVTGKIWDYNENVWKVELNNDGLDIEVAYYKNRYNKPQRSEYIFQIKILETQYAG